MKKIIILFICLFLTVTILTAIEVVDKKEKSLSIDTKILIGSNFDLNNLNWALSPPKVGLELAGESKKTIGFNVSLDLSKAIKNDTSKLIEDAYLWLSLSDDIEMKLGQLKVPFGEETTLQHSNRMREK